MKNLVVIKSFHDGISVIMNQDVPFQDIYLEVARKFRESAKFFGEAKVVLSFEGRELDQTEEDLLLSAITENSSIQVLCLIAADEDKNKLFIKAKNQLVNNEEDSTGQYYKGTLRAGQVLESDNNIIILGDVNPGANVMSNGNIIVLGTLYGHAHAGVSGNQKTFIVSLDMQSNKIQIAECEEKVNMKTNRWGKTKNVPKIAYAKDGEIYIDAITKELLSNLPL